MMTPSDPVVEVDAKATSGAEAAPDSSAARMLPLGMHPRGPCGRQMDAWEIADQAQPAPTPNDGPAVWDLVLADMRRRDADGARKYGVQLQPHNGRDALRDAYEEALDLAVYLRAAIYERDGR